MTRRHDKNTLTAVVAQGLCAAALLGASGLATAQQQDAGARYAQMLADAAITERYNAFIQGQISSQDAEIATLQDQIAGLDQTATDLEPMLEKMFTDLEQFVTADVPFFSDERMKRLDVLRTLMANPDAQLSEKYRRLLEAYQIEMEYGRTMDSYKGKIADGRDVDFIRLGRISLLYRTTDGLDVGYWDNQQKTWVSAPEYSRAIERALKIAKQEGAPDLITVPVPAAQGERS